MKELSLNILDIVQNSISAEASLIEILLAETDETLRITIKDDGIGFDLHAPDDPLSVGLENVRVRLHHAGGKMKIESAPGKGSKATVSLTLPHSVHAPQPDTPSHPSHSSHSSHHPPESLP